MTSAAKNQRKENCLIEFKQNNPHAEIEYENDEFIIQKPWGNDDARLSGEINNSNLLDTLNSVYLNPKFDAIFHLDKNLIEFVFAYIDPTHAQYVDISDRNFEIYF